MRAGFGFLHAKPPSSLSAIAVTPDELGDAWSGGRIALRLVITRNGTPFGHPHGGERTYDFGRLIAHAAATRELCAGTVIGSGTVSNVDAEAVGSGCITGARALDRIAGRDLTPYLQGGDSVEIDCRDGSGRSIFAPVRQGISLA